MRQKKSSHSATDTLRKTGLLSALKLNSDTGIITEGYGTDASVDNSVEAISSHGLLVSWKTDRIATAGIVADNFRDLGVL